MTIERYEDKEFTKRIGLLEVFMHSTLHSVGTKTKINVPLSTKINVILLRVGKSQIKYVPMSFCS